MPCTVAFAGIALPEKRIHQHGRRYQLLVTNAVGRVYLVAESDTAILLTTKCHELPALRLNKPTANHKRFTSAISSNITVSKYPTIANKIPQRYPITRLSSIRKVNRLRVSRSGQILLELLIQFFHDTRRLHTIHHSVGEFLTLLLGLAFPLDDLFGVEIVFHCKPLEDGLI